MQLAELLQQASALLQLHPLRLQQARAEGRYTGVDAAQARLILAPPLRVEPAEPVREQEAEPAARGRVQARVGERAP